MERLRPIQMLLPVHVKMTLLARVLILTECLWKFYMHHHFVYVKRTSMLSSVTKGIRFLATTLRIISIKLPQRKALIYVLFKSMPLFEETFQNNSLEQGKAIFLSAR